MCKTSCLFCHEHYDIVQIEMMEELIPYSLIHLLIDDILRLQNMVMDTRDEVNRTVAVGNPGNLSPYPLTCENVASGIYYDHPSMKRYLELYGDNAIVLWEN